MDNSPNMIVSLILSTACNIRCSFCYQQSYSSERISDDILYRKLKPVYEKTKLLQLVGGEITVIDGMKEYISFIKEQFPHISILMGTNGVAFDDDWIRLCAKYDIIVNFSLNASCEERYKDILLEGDYKEVYRKILDNLSKAVKHQEQTGKTVINNISMVVTDEAADDVMDFALVGLSLGINCMFRFNVRQDKEITGKILQSEQLIYKLKFFLDGYIDIRPWQNPSHTEDESIYERVSLQESRNKDIFLNQLHIEPKRSMSTNVTTFEDYLFTDKEKCTMIGRSLAVTSHGLVAPCYNLPNYVLGDLNYENIEDILKSEDIENIYNLVSSGDYKYCHERCPMVKCTETCIKDSVYMAKPKLPRMSGQIAFSEMCNVRHTFCFQRSYNTNRLSDDVLYKKLLPVYPQIDNLRLLGGEPTIIPGIKEYIRWLKANYPKINLELVTNGVALDDDWLEIIKDCDIRVQWSLNSISEESFKKTHVMGDPLAIRQKVFANLGKLIELHHTHSNPVIQSISMVITEQTAGDMEEFLRFALANGLNVAFQNMSDMDHLNLTEQQKDLSLKAMKLLYFCHEYIDVRVFSTPHEILDLFQNEVKSGKFEAEKEEFLGKMHNNVQIKKTRSSYKYFLYHLQNENGDFKYFDERLTDIPCKMAVSGFSISPDGTVYPCNNLTNFNLGNINIDSVAQIFFGGERKKLQMMMDNGEYPYCWERCKFNPRPETRQKGLSYANPVVYKQAFESGDYKTVVEILEKSVDSLSGGGGIYMYAYSLHAENRYDEAVKYYSLALKKGFSEFWVRYNRGSAYAELGNYGSALEDLQKAAQLDPKHEGVAFVLKNIGGD